MVRRTRRPRAAVGRSVAPALVLALLLAVPAPGVASICGDLPDACADGSAVAACRASGVISTTGGMQVGSASATSPSAPSNEYEGNWVAGRTVQTPVGMVHVGSVESHCQTIVADPGGSRKACGRAALDEVFLDLRPTVPVSLFARTLVEDGCSSLAPAGGFNDARVEHIVLTVDDGTGPVDVRMSPNTGVTLGPDLRVITGTTERVSGVCNAGSGAALHVITPAGELVLGWVSTSVC